MSRLSGNVLLTGASGGIGHAIARTIAPRTADLVLTARRTEVLEPLAADLGARVIGCDLSSREDVARLIEEAGRIDVLIANAALPASGLLSELTQPEIDRMLEVNLRAPIALARALAAGMVERHRGHLAFISSLSGKTASPASSVYSATKFGLRGFALGLREEHFRPDGVGVSVVLPGFVREAGMFADSQTTLPPGVGTRSPEEVARAVLSAIDRNRGEVVVAPLSMRIGASIGVVAPAFASAVSRAIGEPPGLGGYRGRAARQAVAGGSRQGRRGGMFPACDRGYDRRMNDPAFWRELGQQLRVDSIRSSSAAGSGHPTSSMSAADLMAVLFANHLQLRLWASGRSPQLGPSDLLQGTRLPALLQPAEGRQGAITDEELLTFRRLREPLSRATRRRCCRGSTWRLDRSARAYRSGVGAFRAPPAGGASDQLPYRVWVLCGDSEMAEGSIWEAFEPTRPTRYLDITLTAIIDVNRLGQHPPDDARLGP